MGCVEHICGTSVEKQQWCGLIVSIIVGPSFLSMHADIWHPSEVISFRCTLSPKETGNFPPPLPLSPAAAITWRIFASLSGRASLY